MKGELNIRIQSIVRVSGCSEINPAHELTAIQRALAHTPEDLKHTRLCHIFEPNTTADVAQNRNRGEGSHLSLRVPAIMLKWHPRVDASRCHGEQAPGFTTGSCQI